MNNLTRKIICIGIQNYRIDLVSFSKLIKNFDKLKILFCSNLLNEGEQTQFYQSFNPHDIEYFNYEQNIENNEVLNKVYQVCIIKDFESKMELIQCFIENIQANGLVILISNEITTKHKREISYNLTQFTKRFYSQLSTKADLLVTRNIANNCVDTLANCKPFQVFANIQIAESYPIKLCQTSDQESALQSLIDSLENVYCMASVKQQLRSSVSLIEGVKGRGKATAMILGVASAIKYGLTDIYVIAPSVQSLTGFCRFLRHSLLSLGYQDSSIQIRNQNRSISLELASPTSTHKVRFIDFRQNFAKYDAGLVAIIEAGHLAEVEINKILSFNPRMVWASISTGGFHSTGTTVFSRVSRPFRTFTGIGETLNNDINETVKKSGMSIRQMTNKIDNKTFTSIYMTTPIIFNQNDALENCLNDIFCLQRRIDCKFDENNKNNFYPEPSNCELMYVDKRTLFSGHSAAEILLEKFIGIYTSFERKRSNGFLKELSDEPAHQLFCLQQPSENKKYVPQVLCIAHISIEDHEKNEKETIMKELQKQTELVELKNGKSLRIVKLITQAKFKKLGYGKHMVKMLHKYFMQNPPAAAAAAAADNTSHHVLSKSQLSESSLECISIEKMPKLLVNINNLLVAPFKIDYISCKFHANFELLSFWKKCNFYPVQIKAISPSEMECTMISDCSGRVGDRFDEAAYQEMCERVGTVILHDLWDTDVTLVHEVLFNRDKYNMTGLKECTIEDLQSFLDCRQLKKLNSFIQNIHTFESVQDIIYGVAQIYFSRHISGLNLAKYHELALVGFGLQLKSCKKLASEMVLMERIQNSHFIDPFIFKKDVDKKSPLLLSHIRECARVFLNHVSRIVEESANEIPAKKRRLEM